MNDHNIEQDPCSPNQSFLQLMEFIMNSSNNVACSEMTND